MPEQKLKRAEISWKLLSRFHTNPKNFLCRLVTQGEILVSQLNQILKIHSGNILIIYPRKSSSRLHLLVSWWILFFLHHFWRSYHDRLLGKRKYYKRTIQCIRIKVTKWSNWFKRGNLRVGLLLLQDNTPVHTALEAVTEEANCGFELQHHPTYSSGLNSSDFILFPKLKFHMHGYCFRNNDEVKCVVEEFFEDHDHIPLPL